MKLNEEVDAAAAREVLEETGVVARFEGVVALRRALGTHVAGKDDIFFLCVLRAEARAASDGAPVPPPLRPCPEELDGARWMRAEEFLAGGEGIAHGGHSSEVREGHSHTHSNPHATRTTRTLTCPIFLRDTHS